MRYVTLLLFLFFSQAFGAKIHQAQVSWQRRNVSRLAISEGEDWKRPPFEGIGALSAGASSRLLQDYPKAQRNEILDLLFKPQYGASLQVLKVEIGGDTQSTDGSEPSHMRYRGETPDCSRGYEAWLLQEAKARNPWIRTYALAWGVPGWIGNGTFFSEDNIHYHVSWLKCIKERYDIDIDYMGLWNEMPWGDVWYVFDLASAIKVLCRSGSQLDLVSRNVAAEAATRRGWTDALLLHTLYPFAPERIACNSLLRACDVAAWPKAQDIFSGMARSNLQLAAESCSAVIATSPGQWEMLAQMQQKCQLNSVVYNAAINSCEWRQAWQLLQQMRVRSLRQDSITLNSALGLKGDWKNAMQLSDTLQRSGIESTVETHGSILTSLEWPHAMEHLSAMWQSSLRATDVSCGAAMRTCKAPWHLCCFLLQWVPDDRYCHSYAMSACALQEVPGGLLRR